MIDNYDKTLAVKCANGTFIGKETDELIIWKGIPYATQPVGKLRWKKALPAADNNGVYDATKPGHVPVGPMNDSMGAAEFGEDCLVLIRNGKMKWTALVNTETKTRNI